MRKALIPCAVFMTIAVSASCGDSDYIPPAIEPTRPSVPESKITGLHDFAIIGDSYSTFEGYIPDGYITWYFGDESRNHDNDCCKVDSTWWARLAKRNEFELLYNSSYSGSTICDIGYDGKDMKASSFITRLKRDIATEEGYPGRCGHFPDLLFIFGATNDAGARTALGSALTKENWKEANLNQVLPATSYMLGYLTERMKDTRIVFIINTGFPDGLTEGIKTCCKNFGVEALELKDIDKQNGHPSMKGMSQVEQQLYSFLCSGEIPQHESEAGKSHMDIKLQSLEYVGAGDYLSARIEIKCKSDHPVKNVAIFCDKSSSVSSSQCSAGSFYRELGVSYPEGTMELRFDASAIPDGEYYMRVGALSGARGAVYEYADAVRLSVNRAEIPAAEGVELDPCTSLSGWTISGSTYLDEDNPTGKMYSIATVTTSATPLIQRVFAQAGDCSRYTREEAVLKVTLYVSDPAALPEGKGCQLEISSSGTCDKQELSWAFNASILKAGWQTLELPFSKSGTTGGDMDMSSINFIRIYHLGVEGELTFKLGDLRVAGR